MICRSALRFLQPILPRPLLSPLFLALATVAWTANLARSAERPQLTRLLPSGLTVGKTTSVEATGTFKDWPVQVWCSSPEIAWKCGEKTGQLEFDVPADFSPQLVWIRLFNEAGATPAKPVIVVNREVETEKEPNDRITQVASNLAAGTTAYGVLEKSGDADHFQIELRKNEPIYATINANRSLRSPLDANLQLLDERGNVLKESIDRFGYDPGIEFTPKKDGVYYLRVFGFPVEPNSTISFSGGVDWLYSVVWDHGKIPWYVATGNRLEEVTTPSQFRPSLARADATEITIPWNMHQIILEPKEAHYFRLPKMGGKTLQFSMQSQEMGSPLDPTIALIDGSDKQVVFQDDVQTVRSPNLVWKMPEEGEFTVVVSDFHKRGGANHAYYLSIEEVPPSVKLVAPADIREVKGNEEFEWSISLERIANWTGEMEIRGVDLPADVVLSNTKFTVTKEEPKALAIRAKFPNAWQGPFQLVATVSGVEAPVVVQGPTPATPWISVSPSP